MKEMTQSKIEISIPLKKRCSSFKEVICKRGDNNKEETCY
jgi:hypothetical protein